MTDEKTEGKLLEYLGSIAASLEQIALLRAVDAFYARNEREQLVRDYIALYEADAAAFTRLRDASPVCPDGELGWEARVAKYGETEATKQSAPHTAALEARRATLAKIEAFEAQHPLIQKLSRLYSPVSKRSADKVQT
ncbi:hypothetical protein SB783_37645 [Paraburkholderia sp. SIMBA_009]